VRAEELSAHIEYNQIKETTLDLGDGLSVTSKFLNHPVLCLGYRFDYQGKSIAAVFDHEPFYNLFKKTDDGTSCDDETVKEGEIAAAEENEKITQFINGADILIHDAQYTEEAYMSHVGWGHASCLHAVNAKNLSKAKKLVFFHHDPGYTDEKLEKLEKKYAKDQETEILMAKEGLILEA
jgi:phosphoribosyl 1,2-cyclic phosphodiesterase